MNKKGFTLIELLAVLILFGILIGILVSVVNKDLNYAKSFASDRQVSLIEESAKMYYLNYEEDIPQLKTNNIVQITVETLYNKGFIKDKDLKINDKQTIDISDSVYIYLINEEVYTLYDKTQSTGEIIVLKGPKEIKIRKNSSYTEYGAVLINLGNTTITDLAPAYITGTVNTSTVGTYTKTYSKSSYTVTRTIIVENAITSADSVKPIITLLGDQTINIIKNNTFTDPGASATDNIDGTITARITKKGTVDTSKIGTYYIDYDVTDTAGNKAITVTRTVIVY